jgi:hypothetical protein
MALDEGFITAFFPQECHTESLGMWLSGTYRWREFCCDLIQARCSFRDCEMEGHAVYAPGAGTVLTYTRRMGHPDFEVHDKPGR